MNPKYKLEKKELVSSGSVQEYFVCSCDHGNITSWPVDYLLNIQQAHCCMGLSYNRNWMGLP